MINGNQQVVNDDPWVERVVQITGGVGTGLGSLIVNTAAPARQETSNWLTQIVGPGLKIILPGLLIWAAVKILPPVARALRGR